LFTKKSKKHKHHPKKIPEQSLCNKCHQPISFKKLASGKFIPTEPDGSEHWDHCKAAIRGQETGSQIEYMGRTVDGVLITYANNNPVMKDSANTVREKWEIAV
jgi:hypothetical protein